MRRLIFFGLLCFSNIQAQQLAQLIDDALQHNCGIAAHRMNVEASCQDVKSMYGVFQPSIGFDGGHVRKDLSDGKVSYQFGHATIGWNLYRGGADKAEWRRRKAIHQQSQFEAEEARRALAREVARFFYSLMYTSEALALHEAELHANHGYGDRAELKFSAGLTSQVDVLEFSVREANLLTVIKRLEGDYYHDQQQLWTLIGCPELEPSLTLEGDWPERRNFDLCALYQAALSMRTDKAIACHEAEVRRQLVSIARSDFLPRVNFHAIHGTEIDDDHPFGTQVFLHFSVPLWDGLTAYHHTRAAKARWQQQCFEDCQLDQVIYRQISAAVTRLETLNQCLDIERRKLAQINEYWKQTGDEYQKGVKDSPDLAAAAAQRLDSQLQLLLLKRDYAHALIDLSAAVGCYPPGAKES
jgi:outer membrane protein TolC